MKSLFFILVVMIFCLPLSAQQRQANRQGKQPTTATDPRMQSRLAEYKYVEKQLQQPNAKNQYNLAVQADPKDTRKLTMNGAEFRMTKAQKLRNNGEILYNVYENPTTGDQIRVTRLNGQLARDAWARVNSANSNLQQGYKLETKMPVKGRKNEWIISSSNGGKYNVTRYVQNPDGSLSILSADRGTADWNRKILTRGTFQSVQNANIAGFNANMTTTSCTMGSDCY